MKKSLLPKVKSYSIEIPGGMDKDSIRRLIISRMKNGYTFEQHSHKDESRYILDTADWRLHKKNYIMNAGSSEIELIDLKQNEIILQAPSDQLPVFTTDTRQDLRTIISPIITVRALLKQLHFSVSSTEFKLFDSLKKRIAEIKSEEYFIYDHKHKTAYKTLVHLQPLRGYERESKQLIKNLFSSGYMKNQQHLCIELLARQAPDFQKFNAKPALKLDPQKDLLWNCDYIIKKLMRVVAVNISGIIDDLDIEFLHDYRVSLRKLRSLFTLCADVFNENSKEKGLNEFKNLAKITNKLRDIDVYLHKKDFYYSLVPAEMAADLHPFFDKLDHKRSKELKKIQNFLRDNETREIIHHWRFTKIADKHREYGGQHSTTSPLEYASDIICNQYRTICTKQHSLNADSPDSDFHAMRIEFKKIRYMLEFFASLFEKTTLQALLSALKSMQTLLGDFNDLFVQQEKLNSFAGKLPDDEENRRTISAVLALTGELKKRQGILRENILNTLTEITGPRISGLFENICSNTAKEEENDSGSL